jgi:hypothetical protein
MLRVRGRFRAVILGVEKGRDVTDGSGSTTELRVVSVLFALLVNSQEKLRS